MPVMQSCDIFTLYSVIVSNEVMLSKCCEDLPVNLVICVGWTSLKKYHYRWMCLITYLFDEHNFWCSTKYAVLSGPLSTVSFINRLSVYILYHTCTCRLPLCERFCSISEILECFVISNLIC